MNFLNKNDYFQAYCNKNLSFHSLVVFLFLQGNWTCLGFCLIGADDQHALVVRWVTKNNENNKPRSVVLLLALLLKKWDVEKQSSPFRNILSFELHIVFNIFNKYIVLKLSKMWFWLYFLWIQIQISRLNCNHPIGIQDFYLIKRLTPWRSTAAFGSGLLIFAYFLCGHYLNWIKCFW